FAGDVRALVLDCNRLLREWKLPPVVTYQGLCREIAGMSFGELGMVGARSGIRRYSSEWFEAARARKGGRAAGFPRRKKALLPVRYYHGTFRIEGGRLRLPVARGAPALVVKLGRAVPYPPEAIRSVTLLCEAGRLYVDVTPAVEREDHGLDPEAVAGASTRASTKPPGPSSPGRSTTRWGSCGWATRRASAGGRRGGARTCGCATGGGGISSGR